MAQTRHFTATIWREGDWYVSLCPQLDVASQGRTVEQAKANLVEAVTLFLDSADPGEVEQRVREELYVTDLEVDVG